MKRTNSKVLSLLLTLAMLVSLLPWSALPARAEGDEPDADEPVELSGGTEIISESSEYSGHVTVTENTVLQIEDGIELVFYSGVTVAEGKKLTVTGGGSLVIYGKDGADAADESGDGEDGETAVTGDLVLNVADAGIYGGRGGGGYGGYIGDGGCGGDGVKGNVTVNGGNVTIRGGDGGYGDKNGEDGCGVKGDLTVNNGGSAEISSNTRTRAVSGTITVGELLGVLDDCGDPVALDENGQTKAFYLSISYTTYKLWVDGVQAAVGKTSGRGWSYDADKSILTLTNYVHSGGMHENSAIYYRGGKPLTVMLEGESRIEGSADDPMWWGIYSLSALTIDSESGGSLAIAMSGNCIGINVEHSSLTVAGGTLDIRMSDYESSYSIGCSGMHVTGGAVRIESEGYGILSKAAVEISGGSVFAESGYNAVSCVNGTNYPALNVSGGSLTAVSTGEYTYDAVSCGELTVSGGELTAANADGSNGISCKEATFTGGAVCASGHDYGVNCSSGNITLNGGALKASGGKSGLYVNKDKNIIIEDSAYTDGTNNYEAGSYSTGDFSGSNGRWLSPTGTAVTGSCGEDGSSVSYARLVNGKDKDNNPTYALFISGEGAMADYPTANNIPWYDYKDSITAVVVENGVTQIGLNAFCGCAGLRNVVLPGSVNSIESGAFDGCTGLGGIPLENVENIGASAFYGCTGLSGISLEKVENIDASAFEGCTGLSGISLENVENIGKRAFYGCTGLKSVVLPGSVKSICGEAFSGCTGLESVTLSGSTPPELGSDVFCGCTALQTIFVPGDAEAAYKSAEDWSEYKDLIVSVTASGTCGDVGWTLLSSGVLTVSGEGTMADYSQAGDQPWLRYENSITSIVVEKGVTHIGDCAFREISEIRSVTLPEGLSSIGDYAFYCSSVPTVTLPNGLLSIGESAFAGCSRLTGITIPASVTQLKAGSDGASPFDDCDKLASVSVADGNENYSSDDGVLYDKGKTVLILYPLAKTGDQLAVPTTVSALAAYSFRSRTYNKYPALKSLTFAYEKPTTIALGVIPGVSSEGKDGVVFGGSYDNAIKLTAPEGMLVFSGDSRVNAAASTTSANAGSTLCFCEETRWDLLCAELAALEGENNTVTLTESLDYTTKDSFPYGEKKVIVFDENGNYKLDDNGNPVTEKVETNFGDLKLPGGAVLDLGGKTLFADTITAKGNVTIQNGTLTATFENTSADEPYTLTLKNAKLTMPDSRHTENVTLNWQGGLELINSTVSIATSYRPNVWYQPSAETPMLEMDNASTLTMETRDVANYKAVLPDFPDRVFVMPKLEVEDETQRAQLLEQMACLGGYLPEGYEMKLYLGKSAPIPALYVTDKDGNYPESVTFKKPPEQVEAVIALDYASVEYDGTEKTPGVTLTVKDTENTIPEDEYSVAYSGNTNAGTATVTVTDKQGGLYDFETVSAEFTITAKLVTADITLEYTSTYFDGADKEPAVTSVKVGDKTIDSSQYTAVYWYNVEVGTASVMLDTPEGGNYDFGESSATFEIKKRPITIQALDQTIDEGGEIATGATQVSTQNLPENWTVASVTLTADAEKGTITPSGAKIVYVQENGELDDEDASESFDITYASGKLTVNVLPTSIECLMNDNNQLVAKVTKAPAGSLIIVAEYEDGKQVSVKVITVEDGKPLYNTGLTPVTDRTYRLMLVARGSFSPLCPAAVWPLRC